MWVVFVTWVLKSAHEVSRAVEVLKLRICSLKWRTFMSLRKLILVFAGCLVIAVSAFGSAEYDGPGEDEEYVNPNPCELVVTFPELAKDGVWFGVVSIREKDDESGITCDSQSFNTVEKSISEIAIHFYDVPVDKDLLVEALVLDRRSMADKVGRDSVDDVVFTSQEPMPLVGVKTLRLNTGTHKVSMSVKPLKRESFTRMMYNEKENISLYTNDEGFYYVSWVDPAETYYEPDKFYYLSVGILDKREDVYWILELFRQAPYVGKYNLRTIWTYSLQPRVMHRFTLNKDTKSVRFESWTGAIYIFDVENPKPEEKPAKKETKAPAEPKKTVPTGKPKSTRTPTRKKK